jgi:hypothetical protein
MKKLSLILALGIVTVAFRPQATQKTCDEMAADKHLSGAAKTSFVKKCEKDQKVAEAKSQCDAQAAQKNLHGAAQTSFTKKCIADATAGAGAKK